MDVSKTRLIESVFAGGGEMGARMRAVDWSTTVLGAVEQWPQSLRACVRIVLGSGIPMLISWGTDYTMLYNDAHGVVVGTKHPGALGRRGAIITEVMGAQAPKGLTGIHTNMANVIPADIDTAAFSGAPAPAGLSADEKVAYERLSFVYAKGIGDGFQMGLRPQTLYGIADSPSAWRHISLITTRAAWSSSHASLTESLRASRATTSSTISRSPG